MFNFLTLLWGSVCSGSSYHCLEFDMAQFFGKDNVGLYFIHITANIIAGR